MARIQAPEWLKKLFKPSSSHSIVALTSIGLILGVVAVIIFDTAMHATSTEAFCISCHEMEINAYAQLKKTVHYENTSGVSATCSDCHIPKEFVPKMVRKVEAAREVWGSITGVINTPEKYAAHAPVMKQREIARLQANDSRECRNCHDPERMMTALQSAKAQKYHQRAHSGDKTCIDCHAGIAHPEN